MDYNQRITAAEDMIKQAAANLVRVKKELKESVAFTHKFLDVCRELGIKRVTIGVEHKSVPSSEGWGRGSVCAPGSKDGWPAIWRACEMYGVSGGCGNHDQHQISGEAEAKFVDGCYHLKNGKWTKVS